MQINLIKMAYSLNVSRLTCLTGFVTRLCRNVSSVYVRQGRLNGKIAVVTSSSDGIGFAIAKRLAQEGAHVVMSGEKVQSIEDAVGNLSAEGLKVTGLTCRLHKPEDRKEIFETADKLGGLDILITNPLSNPSVKTVLEQDEKSWNEIFHVNFKLPYLLAKESLPLLKKRNGGRIIFVSSLATFYPFSVLGAHSLSNAALLGLTKAAAAQLENENVTVNCVAPGIINENCLPKTEENESGKATGKSELKRAGEKRIGEPDEIVGAVALLASDDAPYFTGQIITPDERRPLKLKF